MDRAVSVDAYSDPRSNARSMAWHRNDRERLAALDALAAFYRCDFTRTDEPSFLAEARLQNEVIASLTGADLVGALETISSLSVRAGRHSLVAWSVSQRIELDEWTGFASFWRPLRRCFDSQSQLDASRSARDRDWIDLGRLHDTACHRPASVAIQSLLNRLANERRGRLLAHFAFARAGRIAFARGRVSDALVFLEAAAQLDTVDQSPSTVTTESSIVTPPDRRLYQLLRAAGIESPALDRYAQWYPRGLYGDRFIRVDTPCSNRDASET